MKLNFHSEPHPYVTIDEFFEPHVWPHILRDLKTLDPHLKGPGQTGTARGLDGKPMKNNKGLFTAQKSTMTETIKCQLFSQDFFKQVDCVWWNRCWERLNHYNFLLSRYDDGDHYAPHFDFSYFTVLLWLCDEPKTFEGGDLIFNDYDITIPCKNNTGVIFLGPQKHEVTRVSGHGRYTITCFLDIVSKR